MISQRGAGPRRTDITHQGTSGTTDCSRTLAESRDSAGAGGAGRTPGNAAREPCVPAALPCRAHLFGVSLRGFVLIVLIRPSGPPALHRKPRCIVASRLHSCPGRPTLPCPPMGTFVVCGTPPACVVALFPKRPVLLCLPCGPCPTGAFPRRPFAGTFRGTEASVYSSSPEMSTPPMVRRRNGPCSDASGPPAREWLPSCQSELRAEIMYPTRRPSRAVRPSPGVPN